MLLGTNPSRYQVISDGVGQSEIVVSGCGDVSVFHQGVVNVPVKGLLDLINIIDFGNTPHADLFSSLNIRLWGCHLQLV